MARRPDEARRSALLDDLQEIVLEEGFESLRVGTMAERLKCSRSTLYKLAPSKDDLIALVFERYATAATDAATAAAFRETSSSQRLSAFVREIDRWRNRGSEKFWSEVLAEPSTAAMLVRKRETSFQVIRGLIEDGVTSGEFRQVDASVIAALVVGSRPVGADSLWQSPHGIDELIAEIIRLVAREAA